MTIQGSWGRAELTRSPGRCCVEDNVVWHIVLIWTAFTQDALSHTQGKCMSVLITCLSPTKRKERNAEFCQQASTPFRPALLPAAGSLYGKHITTLDCPYCVVAPTWHFRWQFSFDIHVPVCHSACLQSSDRFHSDLSSNRKRREVPLGMFLSRLKLCEELPYMVGKLIGPLANMKPFLTLCFRLCWYSMTARSIKCQNKTISTMLRTPSQKNSVWNAKMTIDKYNECDSPLYRATSEPVRHLCLVWSPQLKLAR